MHWALQGSCSRQPCTHASQCITIRPVLSSFNTSLCVPDTPAQVFLAGSLTSQSMNQMLSTFSLVTSQTAFGVSSQPQMTNVLSVTDPTMPPPPPSPTAQTPGGRRLLSVATHDNTDSGDNTNTLDTQGQARSVSAAGKDTADRHTRVSRGLLQAVAGQQDAARLQPDQQSVAQGVSENVCEAEGAPGQLGRRHLAEGGKRRLAQTGFVPQPLPGTSGVGVVFQVRTKALFRTRRSPCSL